MEKINLAQKSNQKFNHPTNFNILASTNWFAKANTTSQPSTNSTDWAHEQQAKQDMNLFYSVFYAMHVLSL